MFDEYGFDDFFNNTSRIRGNSDDKKFKQIALDLCKGLNVNLRQMDRIFAYSRLILTQFNYNDNIQADIYFLLCFWKVMDVEFYNQLANKEFTVQVLLTVLEEKLPKSISKIIEPKIDIDKVKNYNSILNKELSNKYGIDVIAYKPGAWPKEFNEIFEIDFIEDVNEADNYVTIEEGNEKGEYHVYTNVSGEKKLIEVIFIDFFESDSKGWVPEITPGTGQAIAVGGIVVLAAAGVGLLVNNKKKKDEEK